MVKMIFEIGFGFCFGLVWFHIMSVYGEGERKKEVQFEEVLVLG
jgi:hypothetical protein